MTMSMVLPVSNKLAGQILAAVSLGGEGLTEIKRGSPDFYRYQISLAEVQLVRGNYEGALVVIRRIVVSKDEQKIPTAEEISQALTRGVKDENERAYLIKRCNDIKLKAALGKISRDLELLPQSKEELSAAVESAKKGDEDAQKIISFMAGQTPLQKLKKIRTALKQLEEQMRNLQDEKVIEKVANLKAWLDLKTFAIVKDYEIEGQTGEKELFEKLKTGKYQSEELGEQIPVPPVMITDDPKKPLDGLLYNILRAVVLESKPIIDIEVEDFPSDKQIEEVVNKQVVAKVINQREAHDLIETYNKSFYKIRDWMIHKDLEEDEKKVRDLLRKLGI